MGKPVKIETIIKNIQFTDDILFLRPDCLKFWEYIKIYPEKWMLKSLGELDGGFWVVAILGRLVLYYNDIEEGYGFSSYSNYGEIDEYNANQSELYQIVESKYEQIILAK